MSEDSNDKVDETGEVDPEYQTKSEYAKATGGEVQIDFQMFLLSLATSALMALGEIPDERGQRHTSLALARQNIDLLEILEEKTAGNLTAEEARLLQHNLHELRMRYVAKAGTDT